MATKTVATPRYAVRVHVGEGFTDLQVDVKGDTSTTWGAFKNAFIPDDGVKDFVSRAQRANGNADFSGMEIWTNASANAVQVTDIQTPMGTAGNLGANPVVVRIPKPGILTLLKFLLRPRPSC